VRARLGLVLLAGLLAVPAARTADAAAPVCSPRASGGATARALAALRSGEDVWGNRLLRARGGPTYEAAASLLPPLMLARTSKQRPLTRSGVYYVPFAMPQGTQGAGSVMLHVADGGEILAERADGPGVTISVGGERFGSCLTRLAAPRLANGWLPILQTAYRGYRQESFAARLPNGRLAAYVRVSGPGAIAVGRIRGRGTVYARWTRAAQRIDRAAYDAARQSVVDYWRKQVVAPFEVPERRVLDAERALLAQNLALTWRYSIGNPYEEFSFPESVDGAMVMSEYGNADLARTMLRTSLFRRPTPYPNWKMGEKLVGTALHYRLHRDRAYVDATTRVLRGYVNALGRQIDRDPRGLLGRERYSSDIPDQVLGLHSQAVVWQGLRAMADVWRETGQGALAARCTRLAARLERGLRRAVAASQRRLPDGSLFLPVRLLDEEPAYDRLTASRDGSYWNLVAPYALASGLFRPGSPQADGALRYMLRHGSRLLGMVRAGAFALYGPGRYPAGGVDQVYGLNAARFLADEDEPDQLVLSLYGSLAAGMTRNTFVTGEAATVAPLDAAYYRAQYLPPNSVNNAAFLETLRLTLIHETRDPGGDPRGLELAYATPRAWLAPGKRITVRAVPTSFGPLTYTLEATAASVRATIEVPARARARELKLRLRLPAGRRVGSVSTGRLDRATGTIDLTGRTGTVELEARLARR
jgi:hypothetical protein